MIDFLMLEPDVHTNMIPIKKISWLDYPHICLIASLSDLSADSHAHYANNLKEV
jgi:hypothetical protein